MPFLNSNCVSSCHLTTERQSAAIRLGNAGPDNISVFYVSLKKFMSRCSAERFLTNVIIFQIDVI